MITLTEKAVAKLKEISESEAIGHLIIRVGVKGGGCAGFSNDMFFDDLPVQEMDEEFQQDGITIRCDAVSFQYLNDCSIDYQDDLMASGFKFNLAFPTRGCGCGSSWEMKEKE